MCVLKPVTYIHSEMDSRGVRQNEIDRVDVPSFLSVFTFCSFQLNHSHAYTSVYNINMLYVMPFINISRYNY